MAHLLPAEDLREGCFGQFFPFGDDGDKNDEKGPAAEEIQIKHGDAVVDGSFTEKSQQRVIEGQAAENKKDQ